MLPSPDGGALDQSLDQMKMKQKQKEEQKVVIASIGKQGQGDS